MATAILIGLGFLAKSMIIQAGATEVSTSGGWATPLCVVFDLLCIAAMAKWVLT